MRDSQELVISNSGHIRIREVNEFDVLNSEAMVRSLIRAPSFKLPLSEHTILVVESEQMFVVRKVIDFPIQATWGISGGEGTNDELFETPTFNTSGFATVSRTFKCPIQTTMITEVSRHSTFPMIERGEGLFLSYLLGMSSTATPPTGSGVDSTSGGEIRKFHRYPLANIYNDGRLCTGALNDCNNVYDIAETAFESWKSNRWNSDLWGTEKASRCSNLVRFNPVTGEQIMPDVSTNDLIDRMLPPVAPMVPAGVLSCAWEFTYV